MSKSGRIDTSNRISTEAYSSRGERYIPSPKIPKKNASIKLRKGEIVFGQILEKVSKDVFKIKLPNGIFRAVIHPKLQQGDRLYFLIKEINPSLVIAVHSTDIIIENKNIAYEHIIRVLDLEDSPTIRNLIYEYSNRVNRLLKSVILDLAELADKYIKRKKRYNLTHNIEFILLDLYMTGYNIQNDNTLNLVLNYISPSSIRLKGNSILPDMNDLSQLDTYKSPFVKALFVRNIAAKLSNAQSVYYINISGRNYRVEIYKKHKLLQAIISDEKNIDIKIVINQRDNKAKVFYNKLDINIQKVDTIADLKVTYEMSNKIYINSYSETIDGQNQKITYVI